MLPVFFLLHLLCAASFSHNVSRGTKKEFELISFAPDVNESNIVENGILSMIRKQAILCPYIPLCTIRNTSSLTFKSKPCCSECSCNISCIVQGNCCPDFDHKRYKLNTTIATTVEDTKEELACVKTHHGIMNRNNEGFRIIASCPGNFTDVTIKQRCESTFQIMDIKSLEDIIPTFDKQSSRSYKNLFCYLCNRNDDAKDAVSFQSITFWDIHLNCYYLIFKTLDLHFDSFDFALSKLKFGCSIVFNKTDGIDSDPKSCEVDDVIKTCKKEYNGTQIEAMCKGYAWPITIQEYPKYETYKNYACVLCNNRHVSNQCIRVASKRFTSTFFLTKIDLSLPVNIWKNHTIGGSRKLFHLNRTIDRFFPDRKGNIACEKGFVFDDQKNVCRQVLCPMNFFMKNGNCVPIIYRGIGIFYYHMFKVLLPTSLDGEDTDVVEKALILGTDKMLRQFAGSGFYNLSLWCNEDYHKKMKRSRKYFVLIFLDGNYEAGDYVKLLKLVYALGAVSFRSVLPELKGKSKKIFDNLELHFTKGYRLHLNRFVSFYGKPLYLRKPETFNIRNYIETTNIRDVTISEFCYRVVIDTSEINRTISRLVLVLTRTRQTLFFPHFQIIYTGKEKKHVVCLEHALNGIADTNRYIFDSISIKQVIGGDNSVNDITYTTEITPYNKVRQIERSIAAAVITAIVVIIIFSSRWLLKKLLTRPV